MSIISFKHKYSDVEYIIGIQEKDERITKAFFLDCQKYFKVHFKAVFFADEMEDEVFQESFITLWSEIEHHRINTEDSKVFRRDRLGNVRQLTCSLATFLLAIAKNKYREYARGNQNFGLDDNANYVSNVLEEVIGNEDDSYNLKIEIVMDCLAQMPKGCRKLLTMFYYEEKNLDAMLEELSQYSSKDALKSGKSKCLNTLRKKVTTLFVQYHLMP